MYGVRNRDVLGEPVVDDIDGLAKRVGAVLDEEHDLTDGRHTAISCDSIQTNDAVDNMLRVRGNIQLLSGGLYLDERGYDTHHAALRPAQWTASQDNYSVPELNDSLVWELETDADRDWTGIEVGTRRFKRIVLAVNRGNFIITIKHNVTSTSYNRFSGVNGADVAVGSGEGVWLYYDVGAERWRVVGFV